MAQWRVGRVPEVSYYSDYLLPFVKHVHISIPCSNEFPSMVYSRNQPIPFRGLLQFD